MPEEPASRLPGEWHEMTPGERTVAWAALCAWVAWLFDRYELATDDRLPSCWPQHPGIIEELTALKAWREEITGSDQPPGQAASYWHAELRRVLTAAHGYAAGCRTGHRGAPRQAAGDPALLERWITANPVAGVRDVDIAAGRAKITGRLMSTAAIAQALDLGDAMELPGLPGSVVCAGACWVPAAGGWVRLPGGDLAARQGEAWPAMAGEEGDRQ